MIAQDFLFLQILYTCSSWGRLDSGESEEFSAMEDLPFQETTTP